MKIALYSLQGFYGTKDSKRQSRKSGPSHRCSQGDLASQFDQSRPRMRLHNRPGRQRWAGHFAAVLQPIVLIVSIPNIIVTTHNPHWALNEEAF